MLYDIASQCPMLGENAVYKARSMYRFVDDSTYFDDQLLCLPHGIIVKSLRQQEATIVGVVPNPAKDQATLVTALGKAEPLYCTICWVPRYSVWMWPPMHCARISQRIASHRASTTTG